MPAHPRRADLPHARRAAHLRPAVGAHQRRATARRRCRCSRYETFQENRLYGEGSALSILTFIIVMVVSFAVHPPRRRQHPRHDGGLTMEAASVPASRGADPSAQATQEAASGPRTPWWLWLAVAAIVVFCLFPFYWLVNISLKTGAGPVERRRSSRRTRRSTTTSRSSRTTTSRARCATARSWRSSTTFLALIVGSFCAYALARLKMRGKFLILGDRPVDHDVPADRDRRAAVPAVVGHRPLQHADRPDHPVPDVRAAAVDLHPRVVLPRDPEGPRGGGARRRRDALPGVPQGRGAARGAGPGHRRRS